MPDGRLEETFAATEARTYAASLAGQALGGALFELSRATALATLGPLIAGPLVQHTSGA